MPKHPTTPDGRYFVVRGRLWRCTNPLLAEDERERLTRELMNVRRAIAEIRRAASGDLTGARAAVDRAKVALGERGPAWWTDGALDYNRHMARNTPYAGTRGSRRLRRELVMDARARIGQQSTAL